MKILKILFALSLVVSLFCIGDIIFLLFFFERMKELMGDTIITDPNFWLERVVNFINCIGVFFITFGLWGAVLRNPFDVQASMFIKIGGVLFLIASTILICSDLYFIIVLNDQTHYTSLITADVMLLTIGVATLFVADVLKSGILLKQENDLTI